MMPTIPNNDGKIECEACGGESAVRFPAHQGQRQTVWVRRCQLCGFVSTLRMRRKNGKLIMKRVYDNKPASYPISPSQEDLPRLMQEKVVEQSEIDEDEKTPLQPQDEDSDYSIAYTDVGATPREVSVSHEEAKEFLENRWKRRRGFIAN